MEQSYTIVSFDEGSPLRCAMRHIGNIETHQHDVFELDMILTGVCTVTVGQELFTAKEDDVFSIDARVPHSFAGSDCTVLTVQFEQSYFERTLPKPVHPDFICNSVIQGNSPAFTLLRRLIARLVKNNADRQTGYELRNWAMIYELMDVMYQHFRISHSEAKNMRAHRYTARMAEISRIIHENYQENLTLGDLSARVHLSAPYLSKFFEKQFGVTFFNYLTDVRLNHALEELLKTSDTIETVSANSGFPNSHAFVQAFKKEYGVLPSIYRRQTRQKKAEEIIPLRIEQHDYMAGLKKHLDGPNQEAPVPAISCRITLSAEDNRCTELKHSWKTLLSVTSANTILYSDVQNMLRKVQKEIGFRYIRFNGIVSDEMRVFSLDSAGNPVFSFTYVDKVLDFLLSIGLRPFIQISFMPEDLAKTRKKLFGYLVSEPENRKLWCQMVTALVQHMLIRYGKEEVRLWYFSVWHLPDTPSEMYGFSNAMDFYRFYQETWTAVKKCDPNLRFGTPASYYLVQPGYSNWYIPFLEWCRANSCIPDFLNFHYYDLVFHDTDGAQEAFGFQETMVLRETPDGFNNFVIQVLSERHKLGADTMPIFLTEWNNTPSQQDLLNDTCFKSCYIAKGILENYDKLDSFGYWTLTDWTGEAPEPEKMFFGGLGMFTSGGIPKASFYVFTLLRQLGTELLGRGNGWFITRKDDSYQVLLYHYRHFSHLYAMGERFDMTFTDRYTPFSPEQTLDVHLRITDVENGEYMITETSISRRAGSSFDQWIAMGAIELSNREETENLIFRSVPAISKYYASAKDNTLHLDALLDLLEVRLITISKRETWETDTAKS